VGMPSSNFAPSFRNNTPSWPARSSWCRPVAAAPTGY
jgi:hypothetical protein